MIVPQELNFSPPNAVPSGTSSMDINVASLNQSYSMANGGIVQFELPAKNGYIVSDTVSLRYKYSITSNGATESKIRCTPCYTFFSKLESTIGGAQGDIIHDYNVVQNTLLNTTWNVAMKNGNAANYGWRTDNDQISNLETQDGRHCEVNEVGSFSCPLPCMISNAERYFPIGSTGGANKIMLTLETLANSFATLPAIAADVPGGGLAAAACVQPLDVVLSDMVLSYTMVMLSPEAENEILSRGPLTIKTSSFTTSSNNIGINSSGAVDLVYSHRCASLKSLFMVCSSSLGQNGKFDAYNIWGPQGSISFNVSGKQIPQRPLDFSPGAIAMVLTSLKQAVGSIYNNQNNCSINNGEFFKPLTNPSLATIVSPAKSYIGVNTEILASKSNSVLLSGISTQDSPITCRMSLTAPIVSNVSAMLISCYDVIITIDPVTKEVVIRK